MTGRILAAALAAAVCAAAHGAVTFTATCDSKDGVYRCGETATVTVTASEGGAPAKEGRFKVIVDDFGPNKLSESEVDLSAGNPFKVTMTMKKPGFARVRTSADQKWCWGVAFEPEKIVKGSPSPADFDSFWANGRAKLAKEVPMDLRLDRVEERSSHRFDFYRISAATFGRRVHGYLAVPADRAKGPFPADVNVAAAGFGNWTNDAHGDPGRVKLFFSVYPFEPDWKWQEKGLKEKLYDAMNNGYKEKCGTTYPSSGLAESREASFYYPVILGIDRVLDWLARQDYVDATRIAYQGTSQGGGMGLALCALNKHISRAALYVPAMTDTMGYLAGRVSGWPRPYESHPAAVRAEVEKNAPYFDGANFASRITIPVRVAVGFSDTTCPPCAVYAAYNALASKDKEIRHGLGMTHSCRQEFYKELGAWLTR